MGRGDEEEERHSVQAGRMPWHRDRLGEKKQRHKGGQPKKHESTDRTSARKNKLMVVLRDNEDLKKKAKWTHGSSRCVVYSPREDQERAEIQM